MSPQTSQSTLEAIKKAVADGKLTTSAAKNLDAWLSEARYKDYAEQVSAQVAEGKWQALG